MNNRILITGANGFLGTRLVEKLLQLADWDIRPWAHRPARSVRLARQPVNLVWGDLLDWNTVQTHVQGVDIIVHCAYGPGGATARRVTVEGTQMLLEAAKRARVRKFVHISSIAVHSYKPPATVTEDSPYIYSGDDYCDAKIDAEKTVRIQFPSAVILRMGHIWGPFSQPWTLRPLEHIRKGWVSIVGDGGHTSNLIFVDNAVEAIICAVSRDEACGHVFFVTDDEYPWIAVYGRYAEWLGKELHSVSWKDVSHLIAPSIWQRLRSFTSALRREVLWPVAHYAASCVGASSQLAPAAIKLWNTMPLFIRRRLTGTQDGSFSPPPPRLGGAQNEVGYPQPSLLAIYAIQTKFSNEKAMRILNFHPPYSLETALERTRAWAKWARLIP